jgi:hypothetical protein
MKTKHKLTAAALICGGLLVSARAHELFLKFDSYFIRPHSEATVRLLNGTFRASENPVARDRVADVSVLKPGGDRVNPPAPDWRDEGRAALLDLRTAEAGTYVVGLSTKPREIALKAAQFNDYLAHDGLPDPLAERRRSGQLKKDVRERYSKHVKAVFQVGDARTDTYKTPLGYPVEIVPQQNPYALKAGDTLEVLCLKERQPVANQYVLAGRDVKGRVLPPVSARTDDKGVARVPLKGAGRWYVKFIHMTALGEPQLDYESRWATLTFEVR